MRITYTSDAGKSHSINVKYLGTGADGLKVIVPVTGGRRWILAGNWIISREGRTPRIISKNAKIEN